MTLNNFAEVNDYLRQFHDLKKTIYSIDNMVKLMFFLGNPQNKIRIIHVAGTSGKTSTAYYMAAMLRASGLNTGLTISPVVDNLNERVQVNGAPLNEAEFCKALSTFSELIEKAPIKPSWFELIIAFSYWYFDQIGLDYAVIEVGLGGLKDATNVITSKDKVCIITDIGFDHVNVLGNTLEEITTQKAGIIHPGNTVFTYQQDPKITDTLQEYAFNHRAKIKIIESQENKNPSMPDFQLRNWLLSYSVYKYLISKGRVQPISEARLEETKRIVIPGRMDIRKYKGKILIMDGAHNAQKMEAFIASLKKFYPDSKPAFLVAMRNGKAHFEIAKIIGPAASKVITTTFRTTEDLPAEPVPAEHLADAFKIQGVETIAVSDQELAFRMLLNSTENIVVVTGSIYLLGQLRHNMDN